MLLRVRFQPSLDSNGAPSWPTSAGTARPDNVPKMMLEVEGCDLNDLNLVDQPYPVSTSIGQAIFAMALRTSHSCVMSRGKCVSHRGAYLNEVLVRSVSSAGLSSKN